MHRIDIRRRPCVAQRNTQSRNVPWEQSVLCQMGRAANFALPPRGAVGGLGSSLRFPRPPSSFDFFKQVSSHFLLVGAFISYLKCGEATVPHLRPTLRPQMTLKAQTTLHMVYLQARSVAS